MMHLVQLKEATDKTKKYHIGWKDGREVREYLSAVKPKSLLDTFNEHSESTNRAA